MNKNLDITHKPQASRFETTVDGHLAFAEYALHGNTFAFTHTVVPRPLEGRGIGSMLVRHVLDYAVQRGFQVDPVCSFVKTYIDRHPDYQAASLAHRKAV